jgi:hypothetical protein
VLLLVTGASGVGKSTVRTLVEADLAPLIECVELSHVLPLRAPPTPVWRQEATDAAVQRAVELQASGRHLLLSGDPVPVAEVVAAPSAPLLDGIAACLLDASPQAQASRLRARGDDPSVLHHHQAFADWMRAAATDPLHMPEVITTGGWEEMRWERLAQAAASWHVTTIDTSDMSPSEVAEAVRDWSRRSVNGQTQLIRAI